MPVRNSNLLAFCTFVFLVVVWRVLVHSTGNLDRVVDRIYADTSALGSMATGAKGITGNQDLILYSYFETDEARKNLAFFRRHALHAKADFIFILNGDHTVDLSETRHLPNVRIIERANECFDLGGYHEVLTGNNTLLQHYKRFMFVNASVRGPFFPSSADEKCWSDVFWGKLNNATRVAGMSWNCGNWVIPPRPPHLQSMILATDREVMEDVILPNLQCFPTKESAIFDGETLLASKVLEAGYDVYAFEGRFSARAMGGRIGGSKNASGFVEWCQQVPSSDILVSGGYGGSSISPYETIFIKTNRPWDERDRTTIDLLSEHVELQGYSSYDRCV